MAIDPPHKQPSVMKRFVSAWIALGVGLALTIVASLEVKQGIEQDALNEFAFTSDQVTLKIQERLRSYALILKGGAGLFAASNAVERHGWQAYVEKLRAQDSVPGVQGIGFSQVIPPHLLTAHVARIRAEGFPDYTVRPPGARAIYTSIIYLEPFRDRNLRALGFDMFSEPVRRAAMERARDTGEPALSGKVELVQETGKDVQAGTLMYVPVYRNGATVDTVEQRADALLGWAYSPYRMKDLLGGILGNWKGRESKLVDLHIYDGLEVKANSLLFDSHPANSPEIDPIFYQQRTIDFHGRHWLLVFDSVQGAIPLSYASAWATLTGGIALSSLLCGLMLALARTQIRAREIADTLTEEVKHRDELLRESEYRWRFAIEGSGDGLWDWNVADSTVYFTKRWKEMLGFSEAEIGNGLDEWEIRIHPDDKADTFATVQAYLDGKTPIYVDEHRVQCKDGSYKWILDRGMVVSRSEDGKPLRLIGTHTDITERKQGEKELERYRLHLEELVQQRTNELIQSETKATHILQSSADGLYGVDRDGRITFINPAACTLLGYTAAQVIGHSAHALFHHSKPDGSPYPVEECPSHTALLRGHEIRADNETYWHADGHPVPVMFAAHPMIQYGENGGAVISFVDMSEQRAAALARELAIVAAENLARVRSEFLSNMSHEIRTPINGVLGFAEIGYRNCQDADKARNAFDKIRTSGKRLLGVINDILDFSKIEAGKLNVERTTVALNEVIDEAVEVVQERADAKHLDLRVERAPDLPQTCVGDQLRMGQVLLNLLSNAVKLTETGSITLAASCVDNTLIFRVTDTGIGMNEEQIRQLFAPFQHGDGSISRRFGGTGLGLTIAKRIAELMNADIRVESQPDKGSAFEFRLPYVQADAPLEDLFSSAVLSDSTEKRLSGITILVAEDEPINQQILELNLTEDGAHVVMVNNGLLAVERILQDGPTAFDIVLMDMQMPVLGGIEATQRILELAPGLPIIAQTANAFEEDREKCLAAGMVGYIAKPIDPEALANLVLLHVRARRNG